MRYITVLLAVIIIPGIHSLAFAGEKVEPAMTHLVQANNDFALNVYERLARQKNGENLFFSPYSISTVLAIAYAGASGETAVQMKNALGFTLSDKDLHKAFQELGMMVESSEDVELTLANALWPSKRYPIRQSFLDLGVQFYGAAVFPLDYSKTEDARSTINRRVEEQTKEKIKNLIPAGVLSPVTSLVLTNAIYFNGSWQEPFEKKVTKDAPFQVSAAESVSVPMMYQSLNVPYSETSDFQMISLPYKGRELSMEILLPKETVGLPEETGALQSSADSLAEMKPMEVRVYLPRFKVESTFSLSDILQQLGMVDAFDAGKADFSGMDPQKSLYISEVIHKAFVDVNEEGTEAAAATALVMAKAVALPEKPKVFKADHPFVFFIRDNRTNSILFAGRFVHP